MKPTHSVVKKTVVGQSAWIIRNSNVELAVTELGGHMAPVTFSRRSGPVQPYYISPWQQENLDIAEPVLVPLRGDFFAMPFGGTSRVGGKLHHTHGQTAGEKWGLSDAGQDGSQTWIQLQMRCATLGGRATKRVTLVHGQDVIYSQHILEGFSAAVPLGHHATLAMPQDPASMHITTSAFQFGLTNPVPPGDPAAGSYYCLQSNALFKSLHRVPTIWQDPTMADCSVHPVRKGFCDQFAVFKAPWRNTSQQPAWTAASFSGKGQQAFVWFALKNPTVLPATMFWVENYGRHCFPWNGRNACVGIEDVCGFLAEGYKASAARNRVSDAGIATTLKLSPRRPTSINYIQGIVKVPPSFGPVKTIHFTPGKLTLESARGRKVTADVHHEFLQTGTAQL